MDKREAAISAAASAMTSPLHDVLSPATKHAIYRVILEAAGEPCPAYLPSAESAVRDLAAEAITTEAT